MTNRPHNASTAARPPIALTLSATLAMTVPGASTVAQTPDSLVREGRMVPPVRIACEPDQLSSYSGEVEGYVRDPGVTSITIHTDWNTMETVLLRHPGTNNPSARFLIGGRPFSQDDWTLIESGRGEIRDDVRVTAWVCGDGVTPALVDWQLPPE